MKRWWRNTALGGLLGGLILPATITCVPTGDVVIGFDDWDDDYVVVEEYEYDDCCCCGGGWWFDGWWW